MYVYMTSYSYCSLYMIVDIPFHVPMIVDISHKESN